MTPYTVTPGLYPSNTGWSFPDPVTGSLIRGENLGDLIRQLALYRRTNQLPEGDPESEVTDHVCLNNPMLCRRGGWKVPGSAGLVLGDSGPAAPLLERALDWARRRILLIGATDPPSKAEIHRRAEACRVCVHNVRAEGCFSCRTEGRVMVEMLSGGVSGKEGKGLKICDHYAWFNKAAIVTDQSPDLKAPAGCWRQL